MGHLLEAYLETLEKKDFFPKVIIDYLEEMETILKKKRFIHTCGVVKMSKMLANHYCADELVVMTAAALHDYAKHESPQALLAYAQKNGLLVDEVMATSTELLHGYVGSRMIKEKFNISDEQVLGAIAYHTIGRANMSLSEQIVYLADAIEPSRDYKGVQMLRDLAYKDLEKAILVCVSSTLRYVIEKGILVHPNSLMLYNEMILKHGKPEFEVE